MSADGVNELEAWHFIPLNLQSHPATLKTAVILGHGLGGQKDMGLERYAAQYAQAGIASMAFDYRCYGGSDGEPRNLVMPSLQVEDWLSAFAYMVESGYEKIVLHGSSMGGGHVLVAGRSLENHTALAGIISQVPYLKGPEAAKRSAESRGLSFVARAFAAAAKDKLHSALGRPPVGYRLIAAKEATDPAFTAMMEVSESELTKYFSKHPRARLGGWQNVMPARGLPDLFGYAPIAHVSGGMRTPTIIMAMEQDAMCPYEDMVTAAQLCGANCLLLTEQGSHFDVYDIVPKLASKYIAFIEEFASGASA